MAKRPSIRKPPRPLSMDSAQRGQCKFCGDPITGDDGNVNRRASWHPKCATTWAIMNNPSAARAYVFLRDRGVCAGCGLCCYPGDDWQEKQTVSRIKNAAYAFHAGDGLDLGNWELDHIHPLFKADGDPRYWMLGNLRTLCVSCHKEKTAIDMGYAETDSKNM